MKVITLKHIYIALVVIGILLFVLVSTTSLRSTPHDKRAAYMKEQHMMHTHSKVEIDQTLPIPAVSIESFKDTKDGYNIKISVTNFTFTPENVNGSNVPNQGHAHIYVNGKKVSRVYGEWFHLADAYLTETENIVEVTLNANDHSDWVMDGNHIESSVAIVR